jgi:hypothetical protein
VAGKRGGRVPPPPPHDGWTLRFDSESAADGWEQVVNQFPGPARRAFDLLEADPAARSERQHRLRGSASTTVVGGRTLEQWQYELTGAARLLYAIDRERRTVWIIEATTGHPKHTERVRGRR